MGQAVRRDTSWGRVPPSMRRRGGGGRSEDVGGGRETQAGACGGDQGSQCRSTRGAADAREPGGPVARRHRDAGLGNAGPARGLGGRTKPPETRPCNARSPPLWPSCSSRQPRRRRTLPNLDAMTSQAADLTSKLAEGAADQVLVADMLGRDVIGPDGTALGTLENLVVLPGGNLVAAVIARPEGRRIALPWDAAKAGVKAGAADRGSFYRRRDRRCPGAARPHGRAGAWRLSRVRASRPKHPAAPPPCPSPRRSPSPHAGRGPRRSRAGRGHRSGCRRPAA